MALTQELHDTVEARIQRDPAFRKALLAEAVQSMRDGELDVGKTLLRNYIKAILASKKVDLAD